MQPPNPLSNGTTIFGCRKLERITGKIYHNVTKKLIVFFFFFPRAFRRYSSNWKGQSLDQKDEDIEVTRELRSWVDLASAALGMDICALDGVHDSVNDRYWIIELNDSACGFVQRHYDEDLQHVKELLMAKAKKLLLTKMDNLEIRK